MTLRSTIISVLTNARLRKYLVMAICIVLIELTTFQLLYLLTHAYLLDTALSFILAVVLNWIGGRVFIFGKSVHHPAKEFLMVLLASIGGLLIQIGVVFVSVQLFHLYPLIGKCLSIAFSFFWNYFFRARFIYTTRAVEHNSNGSI